MPLLVLQYVTCKRHDKVFSVYTPVKASDGRTCLVVRVLEGSAQYVCLLAETEYLDTGIAGEIESDGSTVRTLLKLSSSARFSGRGVVRRETKEDDRQGKYRISVCLGGHVGLYPPKCV